MNERHNPPVPDDTISRLANSIDSLTAVQTALLEWLKSHQASCVTKHDLEQTEKRILDAISNVGKDPSLAQAIAEQTARLKGPSEALDAAVKAVPTA